MSKVDDFDYMQKECKRLEEDIQVLCRLKTEQVTVTEETMEKIKERGAIALLTEGIRHPEFRKILTNIVESRVQKARNEAIEECQKFLQKHVVGEVMDT